LDEISNSVQLAGNTNLIFGYRDDKAKRYSKLKRTLGIFMELIKWVYETYKLEHDKPNGDVDDFFDTYINNTDYQGDSLDFYDFSRINNKMPIFDNVQDALGHIFKSDSNMVNVNDGVYTITAYNDRFYDQIFEYLIRYNRYTEGLEGGPSVYLSGYFQSVDDYQTDQNTLIFLGMKSYREWLERTVYGSFKLFNITDAPTLDKATLTIPYIIRRSVKNDSKYYIIQNVLKGEQDRASAVALGWQQEKVNLGFNVNSISREEYESTTIITYVITVGQILSQHLVKKGTSNRTIEILQYGSTKNIGKKTMTVRFAAMLPLN